MDNVVGKIIKVLFVNGRKFFMILDVSVCFSSFVLKG